MSYDDEPGNSIPYIDDTSTSTCEDDTNQVPNRSNVNINADYHNRNSNVRIKGRPRCDSLSPVAPLAEIDFTNEYPPEGAHKTSRSQRKYPKGSVMKLVIKGWNSTVSIQGPDEKSSIVLKRKFDSKRSGKENQKKGANENSAELANVKKSKKKKWKSLTKSLLSKSIKSEKRGLDERYPKYVLLKNEPEEEKTRKKRIVKKEFIAHPKLAIFTGRLSTAEDDKASKKDLNEKNQTRKTTKKRRTVSKENSQRKDSFAPILCPFARRSSLEENHFGDIEGVLKKSLEFYSGAFSEPQISPPGRPLPSCRFCEIPESSYRCDQCAGRVPCSLRQHHPVQKAQALSQSQTPHSPDRNAEEKFDESQNIHFGILSTFFSPPVVVMKGFKNGHPEEKENQEIFCSPRKEEELSENPMINYEGETESPTLIVSLPEWQLKSKQVPEVENILKETTERSIPDKFSGCSEEEEQTITETTKYLDCGKKLTDMSNNDSITTTCTFKTDNNDDDDLKKNTSENDAKPDSGQNLPLTKIGRKMYDNLMRMSLNCEKSLVEKTEAEVEGENSRRTTSSPCNIRLESNDSVIEISVRDKKLNFQVGKGESEQKDIKISFAAPSSETNRLNGDEGKKIVGKNELWHPDEGYGQISQLFRSRKTRPEDCSKMKMAIANEKEVFLTIEMPKRESPTSGKFKEEKLTKEMSVGTDDFDVNRNGRLTEENFNKLSPRKRRLLKNLKEKLEERGKTLNHSSGKFNESMGGESYVTLKKDHPGIFLVKHIYPRLDEPGKSFEASSSGKTLRKGFEDDVQFREYYCEDCLATMRIFEDENPSVKSMVNKFETIIQLESFWRKLDEARRNKRMRRTNCN